MKKLLPILMSTLLLFTSCSSKGSLPFPITNEAYDVVSDYNIIFSDDVETSTESYDSGGDVTTFIDITGTLTNDNRSGLHAIILTFAIYDEDGTRLTTATASTTNLSSKESWKFVAKTYIENEDFHSYELVQVIAA